MQEKDKYILVLGSKPNSYIPKVEVSHVYSANAATHRASLYKDFYPETCLVSMVGGREFDKNIQYEFFSNKQQLQIQLNFLNINF